MVEITTDGKVVYKEVPRASVNSFGEFVKEMHQGITIDIGTDKRRRKLKLLHGNKSTLKRVPHFFLKIDRTFDSPTKYDPVLTNIYYRSLEKMINDGISFQHKTALVTGCGKGSIGLEIVKGLLAGGARVIVTTSRFTKETTDMYRNVYQEWGGKDSELIVFPFNQASVKDVKDLINYIYDEARLGIDLDFVIPFAALSEAGRDITNIDSLSELSHRIMLTNLLPNQREEAK